MNASAPRYVYGPVPSRRLGRSLGVDLVPYKTCMYDCVYCQLGRTTNKTIERKEYIAVEEILFELERKLSAGPVPDYISLAGSGEPTLNCRIGEIIDRIKSLTRIPVAVLTNGSLLWMPEVREALMNADLVLPSLDAGDGDLFGFVNRPHPKIEFQTMLDGLAEFTSIFPKPVWLEVFLLSGVTGVSSEVKKIVTLANHIRPARVQLNTVTRPAFENFALAVPENTLESLAELFEPRAEVIAKFKMPASTEDHSSTAEDIRSLLLRRPCTVEDVANALGIHPIAAMKQVEVLKDAGKLKEIILNGRCFYEYRGKNSHGR